MAHWTPISQTYDPLKAGSIDGTDTDPHDRAIFRAMNAKYKPNKQVVGNAENTIFIGRLSPNTDEEMLENHFSEYGEIKRLRLVRDIVTGFSRCYAFIEFFNSQNAFKAQDYGDKTILDEKEIYVDFECERTLKGWIPRRLGGGISGKKESGQLRFGGKTKPFKRPYNINNVQKPEGQTFRDRLEAVESGEHSDRNRDSQSHRHMYHGGRSDTRYRDRYRRSRSRERQYREQSHRRSRSKERYLRHRDERSRERKRSRDRSRERSGRRN